MLVFTFIFALIASSPTHAAFTFSDSLVTCSENNPLHHCVLELLNDMAPLFLTGIPELSIPVLEPMSINNINFNVADGAFSAILSSLQIRGLSKFITRNLTLDPDEMIMKLTFSYPEFRATGKYKILGKIFSLPIEGSGPFWAILSNVTADATQTLAITENGNSKKLEIVDQHFDLSFGKMRMRLNNLFNGDPILGETVNTFLNENQKELFNEYKKDIFDQIGGMVKTIINGALINFPVDKFIQLRKQT